jgi:diaminohydroxyphosphoribosylaminopyrimidine deaminase/5-amino-6-(5-phosphoribosylamino)uracil reductase
MSLRHPTHETADDALAGTAVNALAEAVAVAGFSAAEVAAMDAALAAARQGPRGANPLVGAVVINADGTRIVTGHHRGAGTAHAEADAIDQAKASGLDLSGTTMVVTLEPCNHCGRTGPCAQAIIGAGITDVVYAIDDPHDPAAGGAATLRAAGVRVRSGLGAEAALELNRRWFDAVAAARPFVTLHNAQTLDSRIAASDGTSQWISSPESLADNHALRGRIDAILVGTQTVLVDNPRLTARGPDGEPTARQPLRVVMGYRGIPEGAAINGDDGKVLHLPTRDPREALDGLFAAGVRHLMVEGGSRILSAFLAAGLVDELIVYLAPTLLGSGTPALEDLGITTLADAQQWEWDPASGGAVQQFGRDLRLHLRPALAAGAGTAAAELPGAETSAPTTDAPAPSPAATNTSADSTPLRSGADTAAGGI